MSIAVQCSNCHGRFSAPDRAAGHALSCPKCGTQVKVDVVPDFDASPVIEVSPQGITAATADGGDRSNALLIFGCFAAAALAIAGVAYFTSSPDGENKLTTVEDVATTGLNDVDSLPAYNKPSRGLGLSLGAFKELMVGEYWKVLSETHRDDGTVSFQLLSTEFRLVILIVSGDPDDLAEVSVNYSITEGMPDVDTMTRVVLMQLILSRFSNWTPEEIGRWFGRCIHIGVGPDGENEHFIVQKNGQKLWMMPMACTNGTVFLTAVISEPMSKAPTLDEWLENNPGPPPKSGKSNYHSYQATGKVSNASFNFKNLGVRISEGHFIGEIENKSSKDYQVAYFKLSMYDASGVLIDTGDFSIMNFTKNGVRSFDLHLQDVPAYFSYKIDLENGF